MQDHPAAVTGWTCPEEIQGISVTDELIDKRGRLRLSAILNYFIRGRGPMATTGCDHGALISTRGWSSLRFATLAALIDSYSFQFESSRIVA